MTLTTNTHLLETLTNALIEVVNDIPEPSAEFPKGDELEDIIAIGLMTSIASENAKGDKNA